MLRIGPALSLSNGLSVAVRNLLLVQSEREEDLETAEGERYKRASVSCCSASRLMPYDWDEVDRCFIAKLESQTHEISTLGSA